MSPHSKQMDVGKLKMIKNFLQMYGYPCSGMLLFDPSSLISFPNVRRTGDHPHQMQAELHTMQNSDPYSMQ